MGYARDAAWRLRSKAWSFGSPELSSVLASSMSETILEDLAGAIGVDPDAPAYEFYHALADMVLVLTYEDLEADM